MDILGDLGGTVRPEVKLKGLKRDKESILNCETNCLDEIKGKLKYFIRPNCCLDSCLDVP